MAVELEETVARSIFQAAEEVFPDVPGGVQWDDAPAGDRACAFIVARAALAVTEAHRRASEAELVAVLSRWALAMFHSGIAPVKDSDGPLESLTYDTREALLKATGRDVVADALESLCAGNRAALAKREE